ncbi:MAG TPA: ABC transporter substrate-binding protein [Candidatus Sulfotelmatobacter sp.]|nr:ABC transporter substrate-binding protein [Candidatus Sulfotelmatobacter sp.]
MRVVLSCLATILLAGAATAAEPIKIGASEPMTGTAAVFGEQAKWGADLALSEINGAGGVLGRKLEVVVEDNQCNPAEAAKVATKLLDQDKVVTLLGALCSSATLATMPLIARAQIPFVVSISTAASIAQQSGVGGNTWTFKTNPADDTMAQAMVDYLKKEGVKSLAYMAEDTDYGRGGVPGFADAAAKAGMKSLAPEFFPQGTPDFSVLLSKIEAEKPDRIVGFFLRGDNDNIMRQVEAMQLKIPFTGRIDLHSVSLAVSPGFLEKGGMDHTSAINPYQPDWDDPKNLAFVEKFKKATGHAPLQMGFYEYEAVYILVDAIKRAGTTEPKALQAALKATKYPSMLGATIEFDDHNLAHNNALIQAIEGGKIKFVGMSKT